MALRPACGGIADTLRPGLLLAQVAQSENAAEAEDIEAVLEFATKVLENGADLWIKAMPDQRRRLQELFFPQGVTFAGETYPCIFSMSG